MKILKCLMTDDCNKAVTHIDDKGYPYCTEHGERRKNVRPCRRLTKEEIKALTNGQTIKGY